MANTKITSHVIANDAVTVDMITDAAVTADKLHATLDLSGKTLTLPATAIPSASTATTQSASDNSTKIATTAYVETAISNLVDSAPAALDTLNEIAAALGDDANYAATTTTAIAAKLPLAGGTMTGAIAMGTSKITGLGDPTANQDAGTKAYIDTADALKLNLSGGTLTGDLILNTTTALKLPVGTTGERPSAATGQIRWNTTDGALEVYNGSAWTAVGTGSSNKILDTFTGDGSTTTFTLSITPANEDAIMVFIDGAYQEKGDYVLTNNSLALDTAPLSGEKIAVHITTASVHDGTSGLNQQFTGDGSTVAFTLSQDPKSENNTQIYINGVYQQKTDYTVSGTTLTFDTAPETGDIIEVNMFTVTTLGNTDTVSEGTSNLYFTDARVNAVLPDTGSLSEGSNLYHTDARARGAISVSGNALSYNSSTGVITSAYEESPTFTGTVTSAGLAVDTSTLVVDATNNRVGIGTDSPNYPLTVSGSIESLASDATEGGEIILRAPSGATNKKRFILDTFKNGINTIFRIFNEDDSGGNGILRFVIDQDGNVGIGTSTTPGASLDIGDKTDAIIIPKGTTAQRPSSPASGMMRFNTTDSKFEIYNGVGWGSIETTISATGGTVTTDGFDKIHTFTSSGTFQVTAGTGTIEYLIVAGGAGGGENHGGGGGAGGLIYSSSYSLGVGSYTITVGAAGSGGTGNGGGAGGAGGNSAAFGSTAIGGGGGSGRIDTGQTSGAGNGGSGGGGAGTNPTTAGTGTSGQGNDGGAGSSGGTAGNGGGGGGAGAAGGAGTGTDSGAGITGTGGNGLQYSISGTSTYYAGGGSGGRWASGSIGAAGLGGGGTGGNNDSVAGNNATANTGGGGGGGGGALADGGNGGSGIVIIRYSTV